MIVYCSRCGQEFNSEESCCPRCGSHNRTANISDEIRVKLDRSWVKSRTLIGLRKRPCHEAVFEDSFCVDRGKFVDRVMIFDRTNDSYHEVVQDKQSGEILHEKQVRLSDKSGNKELK